MRQYRHGFFAGGAEPPAEYWIWVGIRQRCSNPKDWAWKWYGGRGIRICSRWDDPAVFLQDMGSRPSPAHSIDRIDSDGDYEPSNCRWATAKDQANNRRNGILIDGMTIQEIADALGMTYSGIYGRVASGWSPQEIASKGRPVDGERKTNRLLTVGDITKSITQWGRETGLGSGTIVKRLSKGWPPEKEVSPRRFNRYDPPAVPQSEMASPVRMES